MKRIIVMLILGVILALIVVGVYGYRRYTTLFKSEERFYGVEPSIPIEQRQQLCQQIIGGEWTCEDGNCSCTCDRTKYPCD